MTFNGFTILFAGLFAVHRGLLTWLDLLQRGHLEGRGDRVPKHLEGKVDLETIRKAVAYSLEKLRFGLFDRLYDALPAWAMILFGFDPLDRWLATFDLGPVVTGMAFFGILGLAGTLWGLPTSLYYVFSIEERHGFNRQKPGGFFADKLKGLAMGGILGGALTAIVLALMEHAGDLWWLYAFAGVAVFQLIVLWLYPVVIMPLFNRFEPVSEDLADDVAALAERVGFPLKGVVSMDGSRRSSHSNAFIIGLVGARRIVLYDTLVEKLSREDLLAVLAHELGHFRLGHIRRRLYVTMASMLALFAALGWVVNLGDACTGLGFSTQSHHAGLVVFGLLATEGLFPFGLLSRAMSRRDEHAADRFAVEMTRSGDHLADALVALTKQNLSSPGSHRLYRKFHNTHPALRDRLRVIREHAENVLSG